MTFFEKSYLRRCAQRQRRWRRQRYAPHDWQREFVPESLLFGAGGLSQLRHGLEGVPPERKPHVACLRHGCAWKALLPFGAEAQRAHLDTRFEPPAQGGDRGVSKVLCCWVRIDEVGVDSKFLLRHLTGVRQKLLEQHARVFERSARHSRFPQSHCWACLIHGS